VRALVTGGAGFLGSHLVDCLLAAGIAVDALDDLSQGKMDNLWKALRKEHFRFHLGSVLEDDLVASLVSRADIVFHLAAVVGMRNILHAEKECLKVNASGSYTVLRHCARAFKRCILFSSSDVYGNGSPAPIAESHPLCPGGRGSARWHYAVAKICSERAALRLHREAGLPVTVVRPFNATGPRQAASSGMVVPTFILRAIQGEPLQVYGSGRQRRTFVASEDLIQQVIALAMDEGSAGKVVNVGGEEEYTVYELALLVKSVVGSTSPVVGIPYEEAYGAGYTDVMYRRPDLRLLGRLGHRRPLRPLRDVVEEMAVYLKEDLMGAGAY
jgi:UDP-glucose 4-epimerase